VNFWEFGAENQHDIKYVLALSPAISSQFATIADKYALKWEFGIGMLLINDTKFAGKDIGSHYQFEDRLGLVIQFDDIGIGSSNLGRFPVDYYKFAQNMYKNRQPHHVSVGGI
jgi:hypothetical protein